MREFATLPHACLTVDEKHNLIWSFTSSGDTYTTVAIAVKTILGKITNLTSIPFNMSSLSTSPTNHRIFSAVLITLAFLDEQQTCVHLLQFHHLAAPLATHFSVAPVDPRSGCLDFKVISCPELLDCSL
ncbi:hypothetical protein Rs2_51679 [Raphanus sativus]|nr:hypothetical protein Rs2_51679 [Raphanus sativus]